MHWHYLELLTLLLAPEEVSTFDSGQAHVGQHRPHPPSPPLKSAETEVSSFGGRKLLVIQFFMSTMHS